MEPQEIAQFISEAFAPFECKVKLEDYNERLRFKVLDKNIIIEASDLWIDNLKPKHILETTIENYKNIIIDKGYSFSSGE